MNFNNNNFINFVISKYSLHTPLHSHAKYQCSKYQERKLISFFQKIYFPNELTDYFTQNEWISDHCIHFICILIHMTLKNRAFNQFCSAHYCLSITDNKQSAQFLCLFEGKKTFDSFDKTFSVNKKLERCKFFFVYAITVISSMSCLS